MNLSETSDFILKKLMEFDGSLKNVPIPKDVNLLDAGFLDSIKFIDFVISLQSDLNKEIDFELVDLSNHSTIWGLSELFSKSSLN
jgi:acyl carrier protein